MSEGEKDLEEKIKKAFQTGNVASEETIKSKPRGRPVGAKLTDREKLLNKYKSNMNYYKKKIERLNNKLTPTEPI